MGKYEVAIELDNVRLHVGTGKCEVARGGKCEVARRLEYVRMQGEPQM